LVFSGHTGLWWKKKTPNWAHRGGWTSKGTGASGAADAPDRPLISPDRASRGPAIFPNFPWQEGLNRGPGPKKRRGPVTTKGLGGGGGGERKGGGARRGGGGGRWGRAPPPVAKFFEEVHDAWGQGIHLAGKGEVSQRPPPPDGKHMGSENNGFTGWFSVGRWDRRGPGAGSAPPPCVIRLSAGFFLFRCRAGPPKIGGVGGLGTTFAPFYGDRGGPTGRHKGGAGAGWAGCRARGGGTLPNSTRDQGGRAGPGTLPRTGAKGPRLVAWLGAPRGKASEKPFFSNFPNKGPG